MNAWEWKILQTVQQLGIENVISPLLFNVFIDESIEMLAVTL